MNYRVPCLGGNTIYVDHTQFGTIPFSERQLLPEAFRTIWPVGFSLDEIMQLAWRVRKWKITGTASYTYTDSSPASDSDTVVYNEAAQDPIFPVPYDAEEHFPRHKYFLDGTETVVPDERFLVVSIGHRARFIATPIVLGLRRLIGSFFSFGSNNATLQFPGIYYDSSTQLFYPFIQFTFNMQASPSTSFFRAGMTSNLASIGPDVGIGGLGSEVGTLTLLGRVIKLYTTKPLTFAGGSRTTSGTFVMEPAVGSGGPTKPYWAFKNKEGLSVYNEDTGVILNDPFS